MRKQNGGGDRWHFMVFFALVGGGMLIGGIIGGYKLSMPQKADSSQEMLEPSEENEEEE